MGMERFQRAEASISVTQVLVFVAVVAVLSVVAWRVSRVMAMRDGRSYFSPRRLFRDLCRLHELGWSSRLLPQKLARARQLKDPAQLFLEPAWFEPAKIPPRLRPQQGKLGAIKQRLFAPADNS